MSKGDRREREAREIYENAGYEVQPFYGRPYGETDGFGHFDLVALRDDDHPRFVQVKSNHARGIRDMEHELQSYFPFQAARAEYAVCHDNEGWRLLHVSLDGYTVLVDEREMDCNMGDQLTAYLAGETSD